MLAPGWCDAAGMLLQAELPAEVDEERRSVEDEDFYRAQVQQQQQQSYCQHEEHILVL